ncbi:hypothetical protein EDC96DRAFT_507116, partial [Choanephora cucurbitarum]
LLITMVKSILIASLLFGLSVSALPTKRDDAVKAETLCSPTAAEEACSFLRNHPSRDHLFLLPTECEPLASPEAKLTKASVVIIIGEDLKPEVQLKNVCEAANIAERLLGVASADKTEAPSTASETDVKAPEAPSTTSETDAKAPEILSTVSEVDVKAPEAPSAASEIDVKAPEVSETGPNASAVSDTTSNASAVSGTTSNASEVSVTSPNASEASVNTPKASEENYIVG